MTWSGVFPLSAPIRTADLPTVGARPTRTDRGGAPPAAVVKPIPTVRLVTPATTARTSPRERGFGRRGRRALPAAATAIAVASRPKVMVRIRDIVPSFPMPPRCRAPMPPKGGALVACATRLRWLCARNPAATLQRHSHVRCGGLSGRPPTSPFYQKVTWVCCPDRPIEGRRC